VTTGSDQVRDLHAEMAARCERARAAGTQRSESEIANTSRVGA
jgi:hypothetical protein